MEALALDGGPRTIPEALPREWPGLNLQDYGTHMYYHIRPLVEKVAWTRGGPCPWDCPRNEGAEYSYERDALPASDAIFARGVVMAVPSRLADEQCDLIAAAYRKVAAHLL